MPIAEVNGYNLSLFLHVTAVVVGFGATFAEAIAFPVAVKAGAKHLPYLHRLQLAINQYFAVPALLIVLATGFYQVADRDWDLGDFWLSGTLTIVVIIAILNLAYFIPSDRKLGPMAERDIAAAGGGDVELASLSEDYRKQARTQGIFGALTGVLLIAAIFLMVTKPGV